ncbi:hypothetical protein SLS62_009968 [Diatrype stigma]|uniref:Uncharacterized protein n=1 Tax=Diatrype stigma TaxID=117547 RepID=A0AAN9UBD5_9PEZI
MRSRRSSKNRSNESSRGPPPSDHLSTSADADVDELRFLVALGPSVSGFPGVAYGGLVTTVLDEILGLTIALLRECGAIHGAWLTMRSTLRP